MKQLKPYTIFFLFQISICIQAQGTTKWEVARSENDIVISYRWVTSPELGKARAMKVVFSMDSDIPTIIQQFRDVNKYKKWSVTVHKCDIELKSEKHWETYTVFNLPWPFHSKDLITQNELIEHKDFTVIKMMSSPSAKPEYKNISRIHSYTAEWKFIPLGTGKIKVIFTSVSYDKRIFPRFVTDPVLQNKTIESITLLKEQVL